MAYLKQHLDYFHIRREIQLDLPAQKARLTIRMTRHWVSCFYSLYMYIGRESFLSFQFHMDIPRTNSRNEYWQYFFGSRINSEWWINEHFHLSLQWYRRPTGTAAKVNNTRKCTYRVQTPKLHQFLPEITPPPLTCMRETIPMKEGGWKEENEWREREQRTNPFSNFPMKNVAALMNERRYLKPHFLR